MLLTFTGNSLIPNPVAFGSILLNLVFPIMSGTLVLLFSLNLLKALVGMIMTDFPLVYLWPLCLLLLYSPSFSPLTITVFTRLLLCLLLPFFLWRWAPYFYTQTWSGFNSAFVHCFIPTMVTSSLYPAPRSVLFLLMVPVFSKVSRAHYRIWLSFLLFFLFLFLWPHLEACRSSLTRDQTHVPLVEVWNLNHWTTKETPFLLLCTFLSHLSSFTFLLARVTIHPTVLSTVWIYTLSIPFC